MEPELKWIIFGSKTSTDWDVIVLVEPEFLQNPPHILLRKNLEMDQILGKILNVKVNKPVNSCFGYWNNGVIVTCQKGSVEETNNSIFHTYHNHPQMYETCPINRVLPRDLQSKQRKVLGSIRMIVSIITHCELNCNIREILISIMKIPEFNNSSAISLFKILCLKIVDLKKSIVNACKNLPEFSTIENIYKKLVLLRKTHAKHLQSLGNGCIEEFIDKYFEVRKQSEIFVDEIVKIIMLNKDKFDSEFLRCLEAELKGYELTLKPITSFILKIKFLGFQTDYLRIIDFQKIDLVVEKADKYKKLAFQLGQASALLQNIEVFEKQTIANVYPQLSNFLFRQEITVDDLQNLNILIGKFIDTIYELKIVDRTSTELE